MTYNEGDCFFCGEPVYSSEGQLRKFLIKNGKEFPTHKKCRKNKKNGYIRK